jgi:hypothetical protein
MQNNSCAVRYDEWFVQLEIHSAFAKSGTPRGGCTTCMQLIIDRSNDDRKQTNDRVKPALVTI